MSYDSMEDTGKHIHTVQLFLKQIMNNLSDRWKKHDHSKLHEPEKSMYDEFTPMLQSLIYGSDRYKQVLKDMGPALQHHYENNSHHPEHYGHTQSDDANVLERFLADSDDVRADVSAIIEHYIKHLRSKINGMSLLDIIEMLSDWYAATQRHQDGNIMDSLEINRKRFEISDQLHAVILNTVYELGWDKR